MSEDKQHSLRPSRSERPGMPQFLATLMVDPWWVILRVVVAIAEGATKATISYFQKRKAKKKAKKKAKEQKGATP